MKLQKIIPLLTLTLIFTFSQHGLSKEKIATKQVISNYNRLLKNNVKNGLVNYKAFKTQNFDLYLHYLESQNELSKMGRNEQLAFYINAYNAICIKQILDDYETIKNQKMGPLTVKGFFDQKKYKIANKLISLNEIENKIIRPRFKEARIHFALVCGAKGCPILINKLYNATDLSKTLEDNTKRYLNSKAGLRLDKKNKVLYLSQIFNWFKDDFGNSNQKENFKELRTFILKFRPDLKKEITSYKIQFMNYDWRLNKQ